MQYFTGERTLEKYKIFPYIAWTVLIGFAVFVYSITVQLTEVSRNLEHASTHLETLTKSAPTEVKNFEQP